MRLKSMILTVALLGCDANLGSLTDGGSEDQGSETGDGDGDGDGDPEGGGEPLPCVGGELCPAKTECVNGLCASECRSDADCTNDEYCGLDDLCHPKTVPSCSGDQDCAVTQTCIDHFCVATGAGDCDYLNWQQDGCAPNAICQESLELEDQGVCYEMPACAEDQSCPIATQGAVCNTGQLPNKDEICLIGMCDTVANCPAQWSCVRYGNSVLGMCSSGAIGTPCTESEHCLSGTCVPLPGLGGGGVCG